MYDIVMEWIGSQACSLAGASCADAAAVNMGLVTLGLIGFAWVVAVIAIRRARRRDGYYI